MGKRGLQIVESREGGASFGKQNVYIAESRQESGMSVPRKASLATQKLHGPHEHPAKTLAGAPLAFGGLPRTQVLLVVWGGVSTAHVVPG